MSLTNERIKIFVIDSDRDSVSILERFLGTEYRVLSTTQDCDFFATVEQHNPELVILDINMRDCDGLDILTKLRTRFPSILVIILTASNDVNLAVKAMKLGAYEYMTKPANPELISTVIKKALSVHELETEVNVLRDRIMRREIFSAIIGENEQLQKIFTETTKVMTKDVNVLLLGESGTGKELVARAIHNGSKRREGPFVVVNCAAISTELAESLLFGHKKGSFTGAWSDHSGFFEQAHGGTIFLDEIGDMDLDVQAKVLRVIEDKKVRKVGDRSEINVDFRIISATNRDFADIVAKNEFRSDLYYRLEEYPINIPPLRERKDDIPLLSRYFLKEFCKFYEIPEMDISEAALQDMIAYNWPGNIRELKNVIQRAAVNSAGNTIDAVMTGKTEKSHEKSEVVQETEKTITLEELERNAIAQAFRIAKGNPERACLMLGISRATLYRKLKKYKI